ncbi:MAG: hypothetical protein ABSG95_09770 [Solirubrobacteraceae bacterium]
MRWAALVASALALALALAGCETTAEKSAKLEREAGKHVTRAQAGLSIKRASAYVKVLGEVIVRSREGAAAAVTLRNTSSRTLLEVPIAITVTDAEGRTLFENNAPGLEGALVSIPSLPAHDEFTWVDDQLPPSDAAAAVLARVGEAASSSAALPVMGIAGVHLTEDPTNGVGAAGTVTDRSPVAQRKLVVFGVARRAGRIIAAGRAVLPEVAAGASVAFQLFFIGDPRGAQLAMSAPATTFG